MLPLDKEYQSPSQHLLNFVWMSLIAAGLTLAASPFFAVAIGWINIGNSVAADGTPASSLAVHVIGALGTLLGLLFASILGASATCALRKFVWPASDPGHLLAMIPISLGSLTTLLIGASTLPISCLSIGLVLIVIGTLLSQPDLILSWLFSA